MIGVFDKIMGITNVKIWRVAIIVVVSGVRDAIMVILVVESEKFIILGFYIVVV